MDRNKIDAKFKWDLDSIYKNDAEYDRDIEKAKEITDKELSYKNRVLESSKTLLEIMDYELECERLVNKLYIYANLHYSLDTRDAHWTSCIASLMDLYSDLGTKTSFISTELAKLTDEMLDKFLKEEPELKRYEFGLRKTIKHSSHILSLECEELLSTISPVLGAGDAIFDKLDNADIDLGIITDSENKEYKLTGGSYREFVGSKDVELRRNAVYKMHEYYKKHANTISECLQNNTKTNCILAKVRDYGSPLEWSLMSDNIPVKFYNKVIESTHKNIDTLHKMMESYKKALNLSEMHIYDINARIGEVPDKKYSIDEVKSIVRNSLEVMGEEYLKVVDKAFNENWIDFYETEGKTSGAFSSGCYDTKPYILLNYTGGFDDIETLAHELGHSVHSYYSRTNRGPEDCDYPIFLAEIASTTQEVLLNNYLLNNTDDKEMKKYILNNILSNFKSTVFRQVEFAEFEKSIHEKTQAGENLTKEDFTDIYFDLQKFYYGPNVVMDDIIKYECLRIPHFYNSFYVYKYATGLSIAYKFAGDIIAKKPGAVENYVKFLSSGGKDYPLNILKSCGIDLEKEKVIEDSCIIINTYLDEFNSLF